MNRVLRSLMFALPFVFAQTADAQFFENTFPDRREAPRRVPPQRAAPSPKAAPQQSAPELADPPYQSRLDRMSEILGALHYLTPLCYPEEKNIWRGHMLALIDAENPTQARHDRMIGTFNRSYNGFKENYRTCNASAKLAAKRYSEERIRLSRELISRFTD
jgi:uncharacterized protein (TIGR02301 family)